MGFNMEDRLNQEILFYSKCKPQSCDAWPVAKSAKRVFVGYPVRVNPNVEEDWRAIGCRNIYRDFRSPDWHSSWTSHLGRGFRAQVTGNRNLANRIGAGSIVIVPRLSTGLCHVGVLSGSFELVDNPEWADDYLRLRKSQGAYDNAEIDLIGDIAQTWPISSWHDIPFMNIPRWISYRLLSRNTVGVIDDLNGCSTSALDTIKKLIDNPDRFITLNPDNLEVELLNWLSPQSFEHLIVNLLQLEAHNDTYWHHVGGSGDDGVDGIGVDNSGHLKAVLQCKWHYGGSINKLFSIIDRPSINSVVAVLHGVQELNFNIQPHQIFLNRASIASLIIKHKERLPNAGAFGLWTAR
jgi:hypothetical protein